MNILWLSWKDMAHPQAGGAELVASQLMRRLVKDGHEVTLFTARYPGAAPYETKGPLTTVRMGNRYTVYFKAWQWYRAHRRKHPDQLFHLIVDEINTVPFFAKLYAHEPSVIFIHQLARQIWFYEMPLPFSVVGFLFEPLYLRLLARQARASRTKLRSPLKTKNDRLKTPLVLTVSQSTRADLIRCGFRPENVRIISEGITLKPIDLQHNRRTDAEVTGASNRSAQGTKHTAHNTSPKFPHPTILAIGALRSMKRTHHVLEAFEIAKRVRPDIRLVIAGKAFGTYGEKVLKRIARSAFRDSIHYAGHVSNDERIALYQQAHVLAVASVKEGWCLTVTEAASQGTPAVVYNVDGLRDSVRHNNTGIITEFNTPASLARGILALFAKQECYERLRTNAWKWSKQITFDKSYDDFKKILNIE